jgi:hypothetical protein
MFSHKHLSFLQSLPFHQFSSLIIMLTNTLIRRTNERGLGTCKKKKKKKCPFECMISGFRRNRGLRLSGMLTRHLLVVSCRPFGTLCPNFKDQADWLLKKGHIGCAETSAANYQTTLCNIPEERRLPVGCRRVVGRKVVWHWFLSLQDGQVANNAAARCWLLFCPHKSL